MKDIDFAPGIILLCDTSTGKKARPFVPKPNRLLLINWMHTIAHPGTKETIKKIGDRYYWPGMRADISAYVKNCHQCNSCKAQRKFLPKLDPRPVIMPRFQDLQCDIVGPLPNSEGHKYLLTVLCRTSRYLDAIPLKEATAQACATQFIRHWVPHFGLPVQATSDQGNVFISQMWREVHRELGVLVKYSPIYSPSSLGAVERQHRDLKCSLKATLMTMGDVH